MDSRLEQYVEEAATRLKSLPELEREQELLEMRQHLNDLVAAQRELGESEESATNAALSQFDAAQVVATDLDLANRRMRYKILPEDAVTALYTLAAYSAMSIICTLGGTLLFDVSSLSNPPALWSRFSHHLPLGLIALGIILFCEGWRGALSRVTRDTATGAATRFIVLRSALTWIVNMIYWQSVLPMFSPFTPQPMPSPFTFWTGMVLQLAATLVAGGLTVRSAPRHAVRGVQVAAVILSSLFGFDVLLQSLRIGIADSGILPNIMTNGVLAVLYVAFALLGVRIGTRWQQTV